MSRDDFDIPEVFRRAMEEAGWRGEGGDGGGDGDDQPPFQPQASPVRINRSIWIFGLIVILILSFNWIVNVYTDWLWFNELAYDTVWLTQWAVRVVVFAIAFTIAAVLLIGNWLFARRKAIRNTSPFNPQFLKPAAIGWLIGAIGLFLAFTFASAAASQWEELLLFINRVPFGINDPIFSRDVGFYIFELPVFEFLQSWFMSLMFVALIGILPIYAINQLPDIQRGRWRPQESDDLRRHVAVLAGLFLSLWAAGYLLDIYGLLYSPRGVVFGTSYTDVNASLWALRAQFLFMALTAVAVFYNFFRFSLRFVLITGGLWLAVTFILGGIYPTLLQRYSVEPNEIEREGPYIENNVQFTRQAFNLDKIEVRPWDNVEDLSQPDIELNNEVVRNVRLWDYRPLQRTYEQLQALRPYYQFSEIDIDRYEIDGEIRQVMLAGRELDKNNLPAPSWVNRNLEFTHGYGIVMNPVDSITPDGQPEFFIQDLPPQSVINLEVDRPEIYYGELTNDAVFVSSGREEFSYPSGSDNVYSSYEGKGGVPLDSIIKRIAFAIRLGDANVLLSDEIDSGTRVQFHRQIQDRVRQIAPFLAMDRDPYIVALDDRLVWIVDTYTVSSSYPYSTPAPSGLNYIRNAAKVVIDAYDGSVDFYITDPEDPIIQAYNTALPGLFQPFSEFPEELITHIRYPQDMFDIQAEQFLAYHMTDTRVFYNKEDLWAIPMEIFDGAEQTMEPYYVYLRLREETEPEYLLIQPFTPAGKQNMISWMAARNDLEHYGELIVYELPKQELVFGPLQVEGRIDQEPEISQQFSLWDQRGSRVIRGNLLVIPLNDSFVFVEPIYLLSETSALPELKRVIVASDTRIAMRETLQEALFALLEVDPLEQVVEPPDAVEGGEPNEGDTVVPTPDAPLPADATVEELIRSANEHFEAAEAAQRDGNWADYGAELEALNEDLRRLMELTGNQ
ncbi:MAG: UPF0182 family protein [Candidatus Promineifilaceae bacterium]|nr:UPF0182 family protein [Candidatus Promineifilaceae bacterium]